jgi:hypothetical protein
MATVTKKGVKNEQKFGGAPYGNATKLAYSFETNSSGVYVNSDKTTAVASADVVIIGVIPGGTTLYDALFAISDAFTASATADIGFQYVDGVDDTDVPQDADYFDAALALDATGRTRAANLAVRPVTLPKDAYLILTIGGANLAAAGIIDIVLDVTEKGTA